MSFPAPRSWGVLVGLTPLLTNFSSGTNDIGDDELRISVRVQVSFAPYKKGPWGGFYRSTGLIVTSRYRKTGDSTVGQFTS